MILFFSAGFPKKKSKLNFFAVFLLMKPHMGHSQRHLSVFFGNFLEFFKKTSIRTNNPGHGRKTSKQAGKDGDRVGNLAIVIGIADMRKIFPRILVFWGFSSGYFVVFDLWLALSMEERSIWAFAPSRGSSMRYCW